MIASVSAYLTAHSAEWWTAVGTIFLGLVTVALVGLGLWQLLSLRRETKLQRTVAVCERWDTDPVIDKALRRLSAAWRSKEIDTKPESYRMDAVTVLNFLESICLGITVGVYDEKLVRTFHEDTINHQIQDYFSSGLLVKMGADPNEFDCLVAKHSKWSRTIGTRAYSLRND